MSAKRGQQKSAGAVQKSGKLIGYARVSTMDQDLRVQRQALNRAGVGVVFEEKASGTRRDVGWWRPASLCMALDAGAHV